MPRQPASRTPLVLITANSQANGSEFDDPSVSLSNRYVRAVIAAGGLPLVLPNLVREPDVVELVSRADGILLSGGNDVSESLHPQPLPAKLLATLGPATAERDVMELLLIHEAMRQGKPLLAICRGHQILNLALGGDLIADIALQRPGAMAHNQSRRKDQLVHEMDVAEDSLLATTSQTRRLGINSSHHQAIGRLAPPLRITGQTADGIIEAVELRSDHQTLFPYLMSVQYHPERLFERFPKHLALFASFVQACQAPATRRRK